MIYESLVFGKIIWKFNRRRSEDDFDFRFFGYLLNLKNNVIYRNSWERISFRLFGLLIIVMVRWVFFGSNLRLRRTIVYETKMFLHAF